MNLTSTFIKKRFAFRADYFRVKRIRTSMFKISFTILSFLMLAHAGFSQSKIVWLSNMGGTVSIVNEDGTSSSTVVTGASSPDGMVFANGVGKIFWVEGGSNKLRSANYDGTNVKDVTTFSTISPRGVTINEAAGKLYIIGSTGFAICNLDGSGMVINISSTVKGRQIFYNPVNNLLYFTDQGANLKSSDVTGTTVTTIKTGLTTSWGVKVNLSTQKLFYSDNKGVYTCNLDGSNTVTLVTFGTSSSYTAIGVDERNNYLFWSQSSSIKRAALDGTSSQTIIASASSCFDITPLNGSTLQASNVLFSNTTSSSTKIDWTNGNGTGRAVFISAASSGTADPANGTAYTANSVFGSGTQIGTSGWYCVYNGTGSTVNISGLTSGTTYRVMVCDYTGSGATSDYNVSTGTLNPQNVTTSAGPMTAPGNALNFDGTSDYVNLAGTFGNWASATIEAQFINDGPTGDFQAILSATESAFVHLQVREVADGNIAVYTDAGAVSLPLPNLATDHKWKHIAISVKSGDSRLYINGEQYGAANTMAFTKILPSSTVCIGRGFQAGRYFKGSIDEVSIWSVARSQADIKSSMNTQLLGTETGLEAYYNFNEGISCGVNTSVTSLIDLTSNNHIGTLNTFDLPTADCTSNWIQSYAMVFPVATAATAISSTTFTANWQAPANGTVDKYKLDVSTASDFSSFVVQGQDVSSATSFSVTSLTANTQYYYRVRAVNNSIGDIGGYSNVISVITLGAATAPTVTTQAVTAITQTTATGNGNITDLGTSNPTAYGVCWNTTGTPTITDNKTDKGAISATGAFTAAITGLTANTTYKVRAFATNSVNTSYGNEVTFTTLANAPSALSYSPNPVVATVNTDNVSSTPTVTGSVDSYSISPALPTGVILNTSTGVISGIPSVTSAQTVYTITATNGGGSTTASFTLTVNNVVITTSSSNGTAVIGSNGAIIDPTIVISGVPATNVYSSASVYINGGFKSSEDKISYPTTMYGVTAIYNAATGVLTLSGSATVAQYQAIFRTIMYQDTNPAASSGTRTFTFELGPAKGVRTLTLSPAAPTANAAQSVCVSGTVANLVATAPAGSSVRWYDAATAGTLLTSSTALVNLKTYYAESWDGSNASASRTAVVLTINALPAQPVLVPTSTAKIKVKLCPGDNIVCSNFDNTLSYQWKKNGTDLTGQTSNQYKVPVGGAGTYSLYVKNPTTGCDNLSASVVVDLYAVTTPVIYEKKKSDYISILIVDNTSKFYSAYTWTYADGSALPAGIVTDRQFLVLPPANMAASYMVNVTDSNACKVSSAMKTVALHTIAAKAYPTMNNGNFMVGLTDAQDGKLNVKIFNQTGVLQKVYSFDNVSSEFEYQVNAAGLQAGAYTVEISLGDYVQSQKIIIR